MGKLTSLGSLLGSMLVWGSLACGPILAQDLNAGMNRGASENNGIERPPWYTKEWPKDGNFSCSSSF